MFYYFRNTLIFLLFFTVTSNSLIAQKSPESEFNEKGVYLKLHTGVNKDRVKTSGYLIDYLKFNNPTQVYLSAVMDWDPDEFKGFIIRMEVEYKPLHFHANGYPHSSRFDEYEIKAHSIVPGVSLLYRIPWRWKLRIYGGPGYGLRSSNVFKNTLTVHSGNRINEYPDNIDLDEDAWAVYCNVGLMFGKRYDLSCKLWQSTWSKPNEVYRFLRNQSITLAFGYRF